MNVTVVRSICERGGKKTRTEIEEERLRHRQGRRRCLQSGFQDLDALFQLALAQKRHSQIIDGLEKMKARQHAPLPPRPGSNVP